MNSSVVVAEDGKIIFALQEERVNRIKNCAGFPAEALQFTLQYLNLSPHDIDRIFLTQENRRNWTKEDILKQYDMIADKSLHEIRLWNYIDMGRKFIEKNIYWHLPEGLKKIAHIINDNYLKAFRKIELKEFVSTETLLDQLGFDPARITRYHHHFMHAAAAYYGLRKNPEESHLVVTLDGGGDGDCSHIYLAQGNQFKLLASTPDADSLGNIFARITHYMGMTPHEHEYKLMGLSAYRDNDKYVKPVLALLYNYLELDPQNPLIFKRKIPEPTSYIHPRLALDLRRVRFDNLAAGIQFFTEELLVRWIQAIVKHTGIKRIVTSGGVFMNVKANKRIAELGEIEYFDVFPSCGDESLPFGAVWHYYAQNSDTQGHDIAFEHYYLGPDASFDLREAQQRYQDQLEFTEVEHPERKIAELLAKGEIVARCSGRMEFGARALGNRSILADPGEYRVIPEINKMIKQRDFWMPFAPAMLYEGIERYICIPASLPQDKISPFMMHSFDTTDLRELFVAGTHSYDKTARSQIVKKNDYSGFHTLIEEFSRLKGKSVVLNTSFNLHGFPIVMGAMDAMHVMINSSLKYLMINKIFVTKKDGAS
jgi:carbamoyltransferase